MFGLRKMADGAIRNQPWCRTCRSGAGTKKKPEAQETELVAEPVVLQAAPAEPEVEKDEATRNLEELLAGPPPA
jgi:hypothetical protein